MQLVKMTTNHGAILIELNDEKAPQTVSNFINYVTSGFYNGTLFHRVINGFMIQGGGLEPGMKEKPTQSPVVNEANNGLKNQIGTIAMARTPDPHSASSQFFINVANNDFLDHTAPTAKGWGYCVFGKVVEGMEIVNKIKVLPTISRRGYQDVPAEDVLIESMEVVQKV
jgi:peptidyl-prolyl cis-trans isomerase B (cyclophilin B)